MTTVLFGAVMLWLGIGDLPYLLLQALMGFTLLQAVSYLEHYANPTRGDQAVRDYTETPALPTGCAGMILHTLV